MSGQSRFNAPVRPITIFEFGVGYSGQSKAVGTSRTEVFRINLKEINVEGHEGIAAVHIWTEDASVQDAIAARNAVLIGELCWASGIGSGKQRIDLTRGHVALVGGTSRLSMSAQLVSAIEGEPVVPWATKKVGVTINWLGSATKPPQISLPAVDLTIPDDGAFVSIFQAIPPQANVHMALSNQPELYPTLRVEFCSSNIGDGAVKYATINPFASSTPIVAGVEFVRFRSSEQMRAFHVFELWA